LIYFSLFIIIILLLLSLIIDRVFFVFFSLIHLIVNLNIYRSANEFNRYSHKHSSSFDSMQVGPHSFTNSFFQVDPNNPSIITLPDGTTAQVQGVATFVPSSQMNVSSDGITTLTNTSADGNVTTVDLTAVTESTIGHEGHILLTGEDGQTYPVSVSGMITVPAMYQAVVANISQIQGQTDASVQVHPSDQVCV